jgi:hypothetical protein
MLCKIAGARSRDWRANGISTSNEETTVSWKFGAKQAAKRLAGWCKEYLE